MEINQLNRIKKWFADYTQSFLTGETGKDSPLVLKIQHTTRVCENIRHLGMSIPLSNDRMAIAETIGLLHDVGRFMQYKQYETFNDRKSANHAVLGIRVINEKALLDNLPVEEKALVIDAIRYHNAPALPRKAAPESMVFMRLIRDADKLDIWKVFADYFRSGEVPEAAVVQHLSDSPECNHTIIDAIMENRIARFQDMKSINDFKLLQLSWVFDLNFPESLSLANRRGDVATIARSMPDEPKVNQAVACVMERLDSSGYVE